MLLYLVRHGETEWNRQHRIQGRTDIPLNDTGREQAAATAQLLARRDWDAIFSSPLSRAAETATIIAAELGLGAPATLPEVVERNYGEAEGMDYHTLDQQFPEGTPVPGRETHEEVAERALPALVDLARTHHGKAIIVVAHGGVIRSVLQAINPDASFGRITNGSIHSFRFEDDAFALIAFNDPIGVESELGEDLATQNPVEAREQAAR